MPSEYEPMYNFSILHPHCQAMERGVLMAIAATIVSRTLSTNAYQHDLSLMFPNLKKLNDQITCAMLCEPMEDVESFAQQEVLGRLVLDIFMMRDLPPYTVDCNESATIIQALNQSDLTAVFGGIAALCEYFHVEYETKQWVGGATTARAILKEIEPKKRRVLEILRAFGIDTKYRILQLAILSKIPRVRIDLQIDRSRSKIESTI